MNSDPREIAIAEYNYFLPEDRVAQFPLPVRSDSKLLLLKSSGIEDHHFYDLPDLLANGDRLVMNTTRVIPARIIFRKSTGGLIEVFCLEPVGMSHQESMTAKVESTWKCLVGGAKKWKDGEKIYCEITHAEKPCLMSAEIISRSHDAFIIRFSWLPEILSFSEVLHETGKIPLPPYFHREPEQDDLNRYQTVFAEKEGSVAAPTAGLHFTDDVLNAIRERGVATETLTLHVGAGTFKPVSTDQIGQHVMHGEVFSIGLNTLMSLASDEFTGRTIAVGTTSMRALESLYWLGLKISAGDFKSDVMPQLQQWECYELEPRLTLKESLQHIIEYCRINQLSEFTASTSIIIAPSFHFRICDGIVTNFHMPQSTLLVLVSAFIGERWMKVYEHAIQNGYRFLSYGDSSLLWK